MPMSFGSIPDIGRYYIPYPQVYLQNAPTFEQPQQTQTLPQTQAQVQRLQPNMQFFGNGQVQSQSQTQQAAQNQLKTELEQNVNLQTRNNQIFGQNQGQTQEISPKSLNAINNSTSLADLQELERIITNFYAIEVEIYLASYIREIMERYHATVVEENYKFTEEGISKWRAEAMDIFPSLDLTVYNDYQLKEYVVAFKSGIPVSLLEKIIDTRRSPDHIRLMFLLSESEMLHVIEHPEYGVSKIQFMFPNLLKEIEKSKK